MLAVHHTGSPLRGQGTRDGICTRSAHFRPAVHPCAGREHSGHVPACHSPAPGRFTPARAGNTDSMTLNGHCLPPHRFTPARAGNTLGALLAFFDRGRTVHPCAGREHTSSEKPHDRTTTTVHPCAGREHHAGNGICLRRQNGSPLARAGNTVSWLGLNLGRRGRFTPARAGNTRPRGYSAVHDTVHPCAGREHMTVSASV